MIGSALGAGVRLAESDSDVGKAGPMALLIILLLVVACYFLFRSMSRHLRRVRDDFPAPPKTTDSPPDVH